MTNGSLKEMSDFLTDGYWSRRSFDLSDSETGTNGVIRFNVTGNFRDADGLTEGRANLVRNAFKYLENVTGIDFEEEPNNGSREIGTGIIYFSDVGSGAWAEPGVYDTNKIQYAVVNVDKEWLNGTSAPNDYTYYTVLHEIGHALGLGHQGPYNGSVGGPIYSNDSWQNSVMSYFDQTKVGASRADPQTMMSADLLALDSLYGTQGDKFGTKAAFLGDTTYGFNTNITDAIDPVLSKMYAYGNTNAYTIADGGGVDTIDVSGWSANQRIDLTPSNANNPSPTTSDIGGLEGNLTLAVGTVIENAVTGSGSDLVIGNDEQNNFWTGAGNDTVLGGNGDDFMDDSGGADILDGGYGDDTASYYNVGSRVDVDLSVNYNNQNDQLINIEGVQGSNYADDRLAGNNDANKLWGAGGNDYLLGLNGNDSLYGGDGNDRLEGATGDDYLDGGDGNDLMYGYYGADTLFGGAGEDTLIGERGSDELHGQDGNDTFYCESGDDRVFGDAGDDRLEGAQGNDLLNGGDGNDILFGFTGADTLDGGAGNDTLRGEYDNDTLKGGSGADQFCFKGSDGYDTILDFEDGVDKLAFFGAIGINDITVSTEANGAGTLVQSAYGSILLSNIASSELINESDFIFDPVAW